MKLWLQSGLLCLLLLTAWSVEAKSKRKIEREINDTLAELTETEPRLRGVLARAHGVLIFPGIVKAGIGLGGEYGEGALREGGRSTGYYRVVSGSIGLQLGAQKRAQILAFMDPNALRDFKSSKGWKIGVDGSVVLLDLGAGGEVDSDTFNQPIIAFILGEKGLMYNISLEGSKISRFSPR
jgi:lipid-binding SYLF domain-containing protein